MNRSINLRNEEFACLYIVVRMFIGGELYAVRVLVVGKVWFPLIPIG